MSNDHAWESVDLEVLSPTFSRQCIHTERLTLAKVFLKRGCIVPEHKHIHEQISNVIEGELTFYMEGREVTLRAGDVLAIPSNVPHRVIAKVDSVVFDMFSPRRQDWIDEEDAYLRGDSSDETSS